MNVQEVLPLVLEELASLEHEELVRDEGRRIRNPHGESLSLRQGIAIPSCEFEGPRINERDLEEAKALRDRATNRETLGFLVAFPVNQQFDAETGFVGGVHVPPQVLGYTLSLTLYTLSEACSSESTVERRLKIRRRARYRQIDIAGVERRSDTAEGVSVMAVKSMRPPSHDDDVLETIRERSQHGGEPL